TREMVDAQACRHFAELGGDPHAGPEVVERNAFAAARNSYRPLVVDEAARAASALQRQAKTGCSRWSTRSPGRPSKPTWRSWKRIAAVGAWMRSLPRGSCSTGRLLSGIEMNRG